MGIVFGILVGIALCVVALFFFIKREVDIHETIVSHDMLEEDELIDLTVPLEKKLRNSIYDCEQNIIACKRQIKFICDEQLDLLKDVGKISHIAIKDKPLFFEFHNPVSGERHFYFERDLSKDIAPEVLENARQIAIKYSKQIELLTTQQDLFEKLIISHKENLERINGVKNEGKQSQKNMLHKEKLSELDQNTTIEEKAIYNQLLISGIAEELEHQEECMRQYIELNEKYDKPHEEKLEEKFKIGIKEIIKQLEIEDPGNI